MAASINASLPLPHTSNMCAHYMLIHQTGAFKLYDIDGDGSISREEMTLIVQAIYKMVGDMVKLPADEDTPEKRVNKVFNLLDQVRVCDLSSPPFCLYVECRRACKIDPRGSNSGRNEQVLRIRPARVPSLASHALWAKVWPACGETQTRSSSHRPALPFLARSVARMHFSSLTSLFLPY